MASSAVPVASTGGRSACNGIDRVNLAAALGGSETAPPPPGPGSIAGAVSEQKTGTPIAAASVSCGSAGSTTTASNGSYSLSNVPAGTYSCTASKAGYASKTSSVTVTAGNSSTLNFVLRAQR